MSAHLELAEYRLTFPLRVRFRDADAMGHVNNAVYLTYLEQARVEYLRRVLGRVKPSEYGVVVARIEIDYKSPAMPDEEIVIGTRVTKIGGASFTMDYRIAGADGRLVAQGVSVLVGYDYQLGKVKKLDEEFVAKVRDFDNVA